MENSWPKKYGGWGIKNLHRFNLALRLNFFWVALQHDGLWHQVLIHKYLKHVSMVDWLRGKNSSPHGGSVIWRVFLQTLPCLGRGLAWQVGNNNSISLGIYPIVGATKSLSLPMGLLDYLADLDIKTLASARNILLGPHGYWYSTADLCIGGEWKIAWEAFTNYLDRGGIRLYSRSDSLV